MEFENASTLAENNPQVSSTKYIYVMHCLDDLSCGMIEKGERFGGSTKRINNYTAHRVYCVSLQINSFICSRLIKQKQLILKVQTSFIKSLPVVCHNILLFKMNLIFAIGPMESEDGKYMIGSIIIVYATRDEVDSFYKNDPFFLNDVWGQVTYLASNK